MKKWIWLFVFPMLACLEPCEERIVTCSQAVVSRVGYCPGVRFAQEDGERCTRRAGSFDIAEWSCERCPKATR